MLTAAVRDLHRAFPGVYRTAVETNCPSLWDNNLFVDRPDARWTPDRVIDAEYPLIHQSNSRPFHFIHGFIQDLERKLKITIPAGPFRGDIYLSEEEKSRPSPAADAGHPGPYWIVIAGGKYDFTAKWWNPASYQAVIDHFKGRIQFVQGGSTGDWHPPLNDVVNLVGRTSLRELLSLVYHADGLLCPVTFAMHLAAAVPSRPGGAALRPCVVVAGGREPAHWEMYPGHQFLHTIGALDCCAAGGCWKNRCQPVGDDDPADRDLCTYPVFIGQGLQVGKCMEMVTPTRAIDAISLYYEGGMLEYSSRRSTILKREAVESVRPQSGGVAVTIGVGAYAELAQLAAREVRDRTGLHTVVLGDQEFKDSGLEHPAFLKFRLFDLVDADDILFFDADMACLADWDPSNLFGDPQIACVRERMISLVRGESDEWNISADEHFNTGLFVASRKHHAEWLRLAESMRFDRPTLLRDQLPLNAARCRLGIPLRPLDRRHNWLGFGASSLSHDLPVIFAHRLAPDRQDLNEDYFKGNYSLFAPRLILDHGETSRLADMTCSFHNESEEPRSIVLRDDGTIAPATESGRPAYWFVHTFNERPTLALASETQILHQFIRTLSGTWISIDGSAPDPSFDGPRLIERSADQNHAVMTEENARAIADAFVSTIPPYPGTRFNGRGIVVCGGGEKYFPCAWACIRMLRHVGCTLPIELWHLTPEEMPDAYRAMVEPYGVRCVDASEVQKRYPIRQMHGWALKPYSLIHSAFEEVMLIDADNVVVRDPAYLFDAPEFREAGAAFWPDFERLAPSRSIWRICGVPYRDEPEVESGQLLIDKSRCWLPLQLTLHLNSFCDFYYDYVHGDKELFHMAWHMLNRDYAMTPFPLYPLEGTMCQHDFQGRRVFQHRNMLKWKPGDGNKRVARFEFEEECRIFLRGLSWSR